MDRELIITCEHSGNDVPSDYEHLFEKQPGVLDTHRGYDIGALELTTTICRVLDKEAHIHNISRLLIDLNRSLDNPAAFSEYVEGIGKEARQSLVENFYLPHRQKVENIIKKSLQEGKPVLHLSVHTFTSRLNGVTRDADVGILYDPDRKSEKSFSHRWKQKLEEHLPGLRYRMNYPYKGTMDGFSTSIRKHLSEQQYLGIELEVNQKFPESKSEQKWVQIQDGIARSLKEAGGF